MTKAAVLVENRDIDIPSIIEKHKRFLSDEWEVIHVNDRTVKDGGSYNRLLTSLSFWEGLPYEKILIFQHDSELLRCGIEEFLEYDFIGANIRTIPYPNLNGGLSLRTRQVMIDIIKKFKYTGSPNEDCWFCQHIAQVGGKLPTKEVAQRFSVETVFGLGSLGIHSVYKYLTPKQIHLIRTQYDKQQISI